MKKLICLSLLTIILLILNGCQPTPENKIVINKNDGILDEIIHSGNIARLLFGYRAW